MLYLFPVFGLTFGRDLALSLQGYSGQLDEAGKRWVFQEGLILRHKYKLLLNTISDDVAELYGDEKEQNISMQNTLGKIDILSPSVSGISSPPETSTGFNSPSSPASPAPYLDPSRRTPGTPSTPVARPKSALTVHQDPEWMKKLKCNFKAEIIEPCSARVIRSVEDDLYIEVRFSVKYAKSKI